jgi:hypothetical protein
MAEKIKLVQGDTRPAIRCTITDSTDGSAVNITGATPRLKFRLAGSTDLTATVIGSVTDGLAGQCAFYPASSPEMLLGEPGDYEGEIEITFPDSQVQTVYELLKFKVREDF